MNIPQHVAIILRKREGLVQTVYETGMTDIPLRELTEEMAVEVRGLVVREDRAPHGFELRLQTVRILSCPAQVMPVAVNKWNMNTSLETRLDLRPLTLRTMRDTAAVMICRQHFPERNSTITATSSGR